MELKTVRDLVNRLTELGLDRDLIVDVETNTFPMDDDDVSLWDDEDADSAVVIKTHFWLYPNDVNEGR